MEIFLNILPYVEHRRSGVGNLQCQHLHSCEWMDLVVSTVNHHVSLCIHHPIFPMVLEPMIWYAHFSFVSKCLVFIETYFKSKPPDWWFCIRDRCKCLNWTTTVWSQISSNQFTSIGQCHSQFIGCKSENKSKYAQNRKKSHNIHSPIHTVFNWNDNFQVYEFTQIQSNLLLHHFI